MQNLNLSFYYCNSTTLFCLLDSEYVSIMLHLLIFSSNLWFKEFFFVKSKAPSTMAEFYITGAEWLIK